MEIEVFEKALTLTCKTHVKRTFFVKTWNDPTVITGILPQTVPRETIIKVKCLTKVLESIFRQNSEFEKYDKWIWPRNLGLRTAVSQCRHHQALQLAKLKTGSAMTHVRPGRKCCDRDWLG